MIFDNEKSLIHFKSRDELIQFVLKQVIEGDKSYPDIFYKGGNLLKDFKGGVAYHISLVSNRKDILEKGLIPNGKPDLNVLSTSIYLDMLRTKEIPKDFFKSLSVYLYPDFYLSSSEGIYSNNIDLYGIDISGLDWRVGSRFLSGNCLVTCNILDNEIISKSNYRKSEAKKYWKNCYSKEEYLKNSDRVIKSDRNWGLDEILYCGVIDKSRIKLIGTFDSEKILWYFYEKSIKHFIKEEYKDNYLKVLKRINRNHELIRLVNMEESKVEKEVFIIKRYK